MTKLVKKLYMHNDKVILNGQQGFAKDTKVSKTWSPYIAPADTYPSSIKPASPLELSTPTKEQAM